MAVCEWCDRQYERGRYTPFQRFCSAECRKAWTEADARKRDRGDGFTCKQCGRGFKPKASDRTTFCSRECAFAYKRERAKPKAETVKAGPRFCVICGQELSGRQLKTCSRDCAKEYAKQQSKAAYESRKGPGYERVCPECGARFIAAHKARIYCSRRCTTRHGSRVGKHVYRARIRGAQRYEPVDPIAIFVRDRWRCYICGRKTDKALRGTLDPLAPELEHIIPIARGGTNTYDNVACACRACNHKKRDLLPEEMDGGLVYQRMLAL